MKTALYLKDRALIRHLGDSTMYQYKCVLQYKQQRYPANRTSSDCLQLYKLPPVSPMRRCDRLVIVVYLFISCCHDWDDAHDFMIMSTCIARFNWFERVLMSSIEYLLIIRPIKSLGTWIIHLTQSKLDRPPKNLDPVEVASVGIINRIRNITALVAFWLIRLLFSISYRFEIKSRTTHSFILRTSTASNHSLHLKAHIPGEYTLNLIERQRSRRE